MHHRLECNNVGSQEKKMMYKNVNIFLFIVYLDCAEEQWQQNHGKYNKQIYLDIYMESFQDKMQPKKQKNKTSWFQPSYKWGEKR